MTRLFLAFTPIFGSSTNFANFFRTSGSLISLSVTLLRIAAFGLTPSVSKNSLVSIFGSGAGSLAPERAAAVRTASSLVSCSGDRATPAGPIPSKLNCSGSLGSCSTASGAVNNSPSTVVSVPYTNCLTASISTSVYSSSGLPLSNNVGTSTDSTVSSTATSSAGAGRALSGNAASSSSLSMAVSASSSNRSPCSSI